MFAALLLPSGGVVAQEGARVALVVGVSNYDNLPALANPARDAEAIAARLASLDFDVTALTDPTGAALTEAVARLSIRAGGADTALFYFAGHAFQMDGRNILVPRDAGLATTAAIGAETINLDTVIGDLNAPERQTLIFLDASRDQTLTPTVSDILDGRRGLARVQSGRGTFVAFATEPDTATFGADETPGANPFTAALLEHIDSEGISISDFMIRVRNQVQTATFERQRPWEQSSLNAQFFFKPLARLPGSDRLGDADLELIASLPPELRAQFTALLDQNNLDYDEKALSTTIQISAAPVIEEEESVGAICIPGITLCADEIAVADAETAPAAPDEDEAAELVQVAYLDPVDNKPTAGPSRVVGATEAIPAGRDIVQPAKPKLRGGVYRTAAISLRTADLLAATAASQTITGQELDPESNQAQEIIAAAYGDEDVETDGNTIVFIGRLSAEELATQVQTELARLGCYRARIDGDWGRGSRAAAVRYYAARSVVPEDLEPSRPLLRQLVAEDSVVCKTQEVRNRRVAQAIEEERAAPVQTRPRTLNNATPEQARETNQRLLGGAGAFR